FAIGCAPIMKQHGVVFPIAGGVLLFCLWIQDRDSSKLKQHAVQTLIYIAGGILPVLLIVIYLQISGVWSNFIFWTNEYGFDYGSQIPASLAVESFIYNFKRIYNPYQLFWIFFLPGIISGFFIKNFRFKALFVLLLALLSFVAISVGFYFRPHYFIMILPAVSISFAVLLYSLEPFFMRMTKAAYAKSFKWIAFCLIVIIAIWNEYDYLFQKSPNRLCK